MFDSQRLITDRLRGIDASGIRRVFDLAAKLDNPINLSIGQPDFDVPQPIKDAAVDAIQAGHNRYTVTQGARELHGEVTRAIEAEFPHWRHHTCDQATRGNPGGFETLIISGVSGGLVLALMTCVQPGDEVLIPDPYFVMYRHLVTMAGGAPVFVDTYPDFRLTAERVAPLITERTKMLMLSSPSNPTGVVLDDDTLKQLVVLCEQRGVLLLADEIYDEFCYEKSDTRNGKACCPSAASHGTNLLLMRGFSKTFGMTGWRLGYAVGPRPIIEQMTKLQQYTFVCAPSMVQAAGVTAMGVDMSASVAAYRRKRDRVDEKLAGTFELTTPGGAFYAFPKVPESLGMTGTQFVEKAIERGILVIPGNVFSERDTHFRISYACDEATLDRGLDGLVAIAQSGGGQAVSR